jgi:hypothetical protein
MGTATTLFEGLAKQPPRNQIVNEAYLTSINLTPGVFRAVLYGLRHANLIDKQDRLVDPELPARLRNPQTRQSVFREILETSYPQLANQNLENITFKAVLDFFVAHDVKDSSADRVARLFMWLAKEAGIKLGSDMPLTVFMASSYSSSDNLFEQLSAKRDAIGTADDDDLENLTQIQTEILRKVASDYRAGIPVNPDFIKEINKMIASIKSEDNDD